MRSQQKNSRAVDKQEKDKISRREQGASQSRTTLGDRLRAYRGHHKHVALDSLQRLIGAPIGSLMTWLVIGIALSLPAGLYVSLNNVQQLSNDWDGAAQISLYLDKRVSREVAEKLARKLRLRDDVETVEYISREQALVEFQALSDFGSVLDGLAENPLPAVIVVYPLEHRSSAGGVAALRQELSELAQVEHAQLDLEWVQRLYSMMALVERLTLALAIMLSVGVLLVIGNTIRLAIESRRDEILVVKLVGGTDGFVRRPFLYTGLWFGLGGGVLASVILTAVMTWLDGPVAQLADLYQSDFQLLGLGFINTLRLWLAGAFLGLLGSWLAVWRHLHLIQPR